MVVREADLLGLSGVNAVVAGVLHLLNEVLMTLLGEAAALLGVKVDVVGPDLKAGGDVGLHVGGKVNVNANLVVLEGNEGEVESGVAVEEEEEGEVDGAGGGSGHLSVRSLLGLIHVKLGVQTPPLLVVLVNALTTDGKLNVVDGTLSDEVAVIGRVGGGGVGRDGGELNVHVTDKITVAGNSHGNTTGVGRGTVHGLLNVLHREVGVALVFRLEEGNLGVTGKVDVLSAVSYKLHETSSHDVFFILYTEKIILPDGSRSQGKYFILGRLVAVVFIP